MKKVFILLFSPSWKNVLNHKPQSPQRKNFWASKPNKMKMMMPRYREPLSCLRSCVCPNRNRSRKESSLIFSVSRINKKGESQQQGYPSIHPSYPHRRKEGILSLFPSQEINSYFVRVLLPFFSVWGKPVSLFWAQHSTHGWTKNVW